MSVERALESTGVWLDDRLHGARGVRVLLRKVFPDHWSFLLGEIILYSFIILLLTGTFLTLWFQPSMTDVVYHGGYIPLRGVKMSEAYASTLNISFDVRGGLLMRQIHHWAADLFMAAIMAHMIRVFFTGAYRKPREINWLIGIVLFTLGMFEGLFGYSLPDDLLSGAGLRITEGILQSFPIVGTYLAYFLFGGPFPGHDIIPRLYILHVLVIPGLILALVTVHLFLMFHQKHTQMPGKGRTNTNVVGAPTYPYFMAKTGAFFFFVFACLTLAATFTQINPVWLYGPFNPVAISAGSQPDFYMGALEGSLRMFPPWQWVFFHHTFAFNVFVPALLPLGIVFGGAAIWPFLEQSTTWISRSTSRRGSPGLRSLWRPRSPTGPPSASASASSARTTSFWSTEWRPASSGSCPGASSSRRPDRSTPSRWQFWRPGRRTRRYRRARAPRPRSRPAACAAGSARCASVCTTW
jgi:ubiquinol-cytochrome c reductase cytochrome b subunit